jgi:hypothetical protein
MSCLKLVTKNDGAEQYFAFTFGSPRSRSSYLQYIKDVFGEFNVITSPGDSRVVKLGLKEPEVIKKLKLSGITVKMDSLPTITPKELEEITCESLTKIGIKQYLKKIVTEGDGAEQYFAFVFNTGRTARRYKSGIEKVFGKDVVNIKNKVVTLKLTKGGVSQILISQGLVTIDELEELDNITEQDLEDAKESKEPPEYILTESKIKNYLKIINKNENKTQCYAFVFELERHAKGYLPDIKEMFNNSSIQQGRVVELFLTQDKITSILRDKDVGISTLTSITEEEFNANKEKEKLLLKPNVIKSYFRELQFLDTSQAGFVFAKSGTAANYRGQIRGMFPKCTEESCGNGRIFKLGVSVEEAKLILILIDNDLKVDNDYSPQKFTKEDLERMKKTKERRSKTNLDLTTSTSLDTVMSVELLEDKVKENNKTARKSKPEFEREDDGVDEEDVEMEDVPEDHLEDVKGKVKMSGPSIGFEIEHLADLPGLGMLIVKPASGTKEYEPSYNDIIADTCEIEDYPADNIYLTPDRDGYDDKEFKGYWGIEFKGVPNFLNHQDESVNLEELIFIVRHFHAWVRKKCREEQKTSKKSTRQKARISHDINLEHWMDDYNKEAQEKGFKEIFYSHSHNDKNRKWYIRLKAEDLEQDAQPRYSTQINATIPTKFLSSEEIRKLFGYNPPFQGQNRNPSPNFSVLDDNKKFIDYEKQIFKKCLKLADEFFDRHFKEKFTKNEKSSSFRKLEKIRAFLRTITYSIAMTHIPQSKLDELFDDNKAKSQTIHKDIFPVFLPRFTMRDFFDHLLSDDDRRILLEIKKDKIIGLLKSVAEFDKKDCVPPFQIDDFYRYTFLQDDSLSKVVLIDADLLTPPDPISITLNNIFKSSPFGENKDKSREKMAGVVEFRNPEQGERTLEDTDKLVTEAKKKYEEFCKNPPTISVFSETPVNTRLQMEMKTKPHRKRPLEDDKDARQVMPNINLQPRKSNRLKEGDCEIVARMSTNLCQFK